MSDFNSRTLPQGGVGAGGAPAGSTGPVCAFARPGRRPRRGRPSPRQAGCCAGSTSCQAEDDAFADMVEAFKEATGIKMNVFSECFEDIQPKASVAANTGAGPIWSGACTRCRTVPDKCST